MSRSRKSKRKPRRLAPAETTGKEKTVPKRSWRWRVALLLFPVVLAAAGSGGFWLRNRAHGATQLVEFAAGDGLDSNGLVSDTPGTDAAQPDEKSSTTIDTGKTSDTVGADDSTASIDNSPTTPVAPSENTSTSGTSPVSPSTPTTNPPSQQVSPTQSAKSETTNAAAPVTPASTVQTAATPNAAWDAPVASIIELQPYRETQTITNTRGDSITLINLNKNVGAFYVLETNIAGQKLSFELEVPSVQANPALRPILSLNQDGLTLAMLNHQTRQFALWPNPSGPAPATFASNTGSPQATHLNEAPVFAADMQAAVRADAPYTAICEGLLLVRSQKTGSSTLMESTTDLLRKAPLGDWFVEALKPYLIPKPEFASDGGGDGSQPLPVAGPKPAAVDATFEGETLSPSSLTIATDAPNHKMLYGRWYRATSHPGTFVSVMKASAADKTILDSYKDRVSSLGARGAGEADALVYLVAFDISHFRFGYGLGAEHPHIGWSPNDILPHAATGGPDGFDSKAPLVTIGAVPPYEAPYVEATFSGGFKRQHGAFKNGPLSKVNNGSHFGFVERGVIFSRLMPGLATACIGLDGSINLVTWPLDATVLPPKIMDARQNCVPIVEGIDAQGMSIPGEWVNEWGPGAWSGSQTGNFLTTRSGMGMQDSGGKTFIMVAYFTGSTPNAMARVFQAYHCRYAMLLDMNSLSACYLALYNRDAEGHVASAEYLHRDMAAVNSPKGTYRFLQTDDTRDFFYITRIPEEQHTAAVDTHSR